MTLNKQRNSLIVEMVAYFDYFRSFVLISHCAHRSVKPRHLTIPNPENGFSSVIGYVLQINVGNTKALLVCLFNDHLQVLSQSKIRT
jgi:hypothetical protein